MELKEVNEGLLSEANVESRNEWGVLAQFYFSLLMRCLCGVFGVLTFLSLIWGGVEYLTVTTSAWFTVLMCVLIGIATLELVLRIVIFRWSTLRGNLYTVLDLLTVLTCIILFFIELHRTLRVVAVALFSLRTFILVARVIYLCRCHRTLRRGTPVPTEAPETHHLENALKTNREIMNMIYQPRMETLCEEDEQLECSPPVASPPW